MIYLQPPGGCHPELSSKTPYSKANVLRGDLQPLALCQGLLYVHQDQKGRSLDQCHRHIRSGAQCYADLFLGKYQRVGDVGAVRSDPVG